MAGVANEPVDTIEAYGTFTPPESPCGCQWVEESGGWTIEHDDNCEEN